MLNELQMQQYELNVSIYDQSDFFSNKLVGSGSIGLHYLYEQSGHEIFQRWISITHPESTKLESAVKFYLLVKKLLGIFVDFLLYYWSR